MRRCIPDECEHCIAWGPAVPGKVRCERNRVPPQRDGHSESATLGRGWFSTTLGARCVHEGETLRLF